MFVVFEMLPIAVKQPQNLDTDVDQQGPLTYFQQQVLKGYEDSDEFDKLYVAQQRKCEE